MADIIEQLGERYINTVNRSVTYWDSMPDWEKKMVMEGMQKAIEALDIIVVNKDEKPIEGDEVRIIGGHYHDKIIKFPIPEQLKARFTGTYKDGTSSDYQGCKIILRNGKTVKYRE